MLSTIDSFSLFRQRLVQTLLRSVVALYELFLKNVQLLTYNKICIIELFLSEKFHRSIDNILTNIRINIKILLLSIFN